MRTLGKVSNGEGGMSGVWGMGGGYENNINLKKAIEFVTTGNPVNSHLTFTLDKTHHRPVISPFLCKFYNCFLKCF